MSKTLGTIQKLAKLGKVLSTIVFVFCLVGAIGCAVGLISLQMLPDSIQLGDVTVEGVIDNPEALSRGTLCAAMVTGVIMCVGEAVLAKLAQRYFKHELAAGTPFTFAGAKEMRRLGIFAIVIPIITMAATDITVEVIARVMPDVADRAFTDPVSVGLGIMLIVMSLLCQYGTELSEKK